VFQTLKGKIISSPVLKYPVFSQRFILTADASGEGLDAVLSQGEIGKDLPVVFASRTLNRAEKNYRTTERNFYHRVGACGISDPIYTGKR